MLFTAAQAANTVAHDSGMRIRIARLRTREFSATLPSPGNAPRPSITGPPRYRTANANVTTYFSSSSATKNIASSTSKMTSTIGATPLAAAIPALAPPAAVRPNVLASASLIA